MFVNIVINVPKVDSVQKTCGLVRFRAILVKYGESKMKTIDRITFNPEVMGGKPCIRGLRVTVGTLVGLVAAGRTKDEILALYPYLEPQDIDQALTYAAWRVEEIDIPLNPA